MNVMTYNGKEKVISTCRLLSNSAHFQQPQSKFSSACEPLQKLAFECIEKHHGDRMACTEYFKAYRECKKDEHKKILEARAKG